MNIHPLAEYFPIMEDAAFSELLADIDANGLLDPITILGDLVLDGRHRLMACQRLGIEPKTVEYDGDDPRSFVISKNVKRRHLTETQLAAIGAKMATATVGGDRFSEEHSAHVQNANEVTVAEAAEELGVSERSIHLAKRVLRECDPAVFEAMERDEVKVRDAANIVGESHEDQREALQRVKEKKAQTTTSAIHIMRNERMSEETMPALPEGEYRVVVIDPPWDVGFAMDRTDEVLRDAGPPYSVMSLDEIKAMELPLADDAWVFLWTIQQFLRESFEVLEAWGVQHRFTMVWHKPHSMQAKGMPRSNGEFVLVGKNGKPEFRDTKQFDMVFNAPRREGHSAKPDEFYETIKRVTVGPRLDMFSRRLIEGFYPWGKEAKI